MSSREFPTPPTTADTVEPVTLDEWIDAGERVTILDVRPPEAFAAWHITGDTVDIENVPVTRFLDDQPDDSVLDAVPVGDPLIVLCAKGYASAYVAGTLAAAGRDVVVLADGMDGWARVYDRLEITRYDGPGTVYQYQRPASGCLAHLVVSADDAAVIDPLRAFTDRYLDDARELGVDLRYALDTHIHADHVSGLRALADRGVTAVLPEAATARGVTYTDEITTVADGESLSVGETPIDVRHTPGHTSGMTTYVIGTRLLATGDGLFVDSVARPDLEAGDDGAPDAARQLYRSLQTKLLTLDDDVLVCGTHVSPDTRPTADGTYIATIGQLTTELAVLSMDEQTFVERILSEMPPRPANYERIIAANLGTRTVDDTEAFELELGPNNCAVSREAITGD
jgi:glyoxylase-like metal-dependent hydrolase (beta-lactamase superfamily II)